MNLQNDVMTLLVETNHSSVLCRCKSFTSGNSVSVGLLNTSVRFVPISLRRYAQMRTIDWNSQNYHIDPNGSLEVLPDYLITSEYRRLKELAILREESIWALELYLQEGIGRVNTYYDDTLAAFLISELNKCDPANNYYTDAIYEYATICEIEPSFAYQELNLKSQTAGLVTLRNKAIYDKYVIKFGSVYTRQECDLLIKQALDDAFRKHRL